MLHFDRAAGSQGPVKVLKFALGQNYVSYTRKAIS